MDNKEIIAKIVNLPRDYYASGDISAYTLLQDSGYFLVYKQINKDDILQELRNNNTNIIDDWVNWSANKRVESGWYFEKSNNDYCVGLYLNGQGTTKELYCEPQEACAAFIEHEIEDIRQS